MRNRRLACSALLAVVVATTATGCATKSPAAEKARERKAAGVALFHLQCSKDLWNYVEQLSAAFGSHTQNDIPAKVTPAGGRLVTVELTGPNLVNLLQKLDFFAHGGEGNHDPRAMRMYDGLAPVIDSIGPIRPGQSVPLAVINDTAGGAVPTPSLTTKPTPTHKGT